MILAVALVAGFSMLAPVDHDPMYHCSLVMIEEGYTTEFSLKFCNEVLEKK